MAQLESLEKSWKVAMGHEARRFQLKPVMIEAFRFGIDPEPWWWVEQTRAQIVVTQVYGRDKLPFGAQIETLEGLKDVNKGDWVVRDSNGEIKPYTERAFLETFEAGDLQ